MGTTINLTSMYIPGERERERESERARREREREREREKRFMGKRVVL